MRQGKTRFRLPKEARLRRCAEIENTIKNGKKISTKNLLFYIQKSSSMTSRLAVRVSKKFGKAVKRNLARRLIKEIFRLSTPHFKHPIDIVVVVKRQGKWPDFQVYENEFQEALAIYQKSCLDVRLGN